MSTSTQPRTSSGHARHNSSSGGSSSGGSFAAPVPPSPSSVTAGFSPGGQVPSGYSYLHRSHSLLTPTRRNVPSGLGKGEKEAMGNVKVSNSNNSTAKPDVTAETQPWQSAPPPAPPQRLQRSLTTSSSSSSIVSLSSPEPEMRKLSEQETVAALVAKLPANPKAWTPSQVALYLTHVLGLTPRPIVEDVTAYVRRAHMGGRVFLRLKASDLEEEGLNTKWRRLMIEAVKKLRRDCLRGRIWGHEGGMQWPRQDDVEEQDEAENEADGKALDDSKKTGPAYAKGTLKRLRDKKQVRGMIRSFESAADLAQDEGAASTPRSPIIVRRESVDSLASSQATSSSPREPMAPIYGEGYVKQRAESFTSLSEMSGDEASRKKRHFEMAELEHWFGSLSEQEAASLVSELEDDDLNFDDDDEHRDMVKAEHEHQRSSSSHSGTGTGESAPGTPPPHSPLGFTPLDASLVQSIIGGADPSEAGGEGTVTKKHDDDRATFGLGLGLAMVPPPRRMDVELDDETEAEAAARRNAHLRPGRSNGGKSNPYRSSTYDVEEREALGIGADEDDDIKYGTARKIVAKPDEDDSGLLADNEMDVPAAKGSIRIRNPAPGREDSRSLFASDATGASVVPQAEAKAESSQPSHMSHMSHMSAHEASGVAPYKPLSPGVSRRTSVKRQEEAAAAAEESYDAIPPSSLASMANEMSKAGTFGRKAGSRRSGQLKQLVALHSTTHEDDGKTHASVAAEDEGKWGGTLSRKNSRRGNPVALQLQESLTPPVAASSSSTSSSSQPPPPPPQRDNLRQRMMDLFSPIDDEKPAEAAKDDCSAELSAENLQALDELLKQGQEEKAQEQLPAEGQATEGDGNVEMLSVPLTTLAPSPDGKGSIKKTSMVLVERKRFESLARRMGVLEDQLSQLDALTESGSALGVGSFASSSAGEKSHARRRTALEEVFTIPQHAGQVSKDEERETKPSATHEDESDEEDVQSWGFNFGRPLKLGAIPSYALGLAAGAGFMLLSEVLGRGRH